MNQPVASKKRLTLSELRTNEHTIMAALAVAVGLAGGFGAVGFRYLINFFQTLAYGSSDELLHVVLALPWHVKVWVPAVGGLVVGPIVYFLAREAKGHGVPEVMEAVALRSGIIRKRVVFIKSLASAICIGTGGSVGREGPIVQIGSAIGSTIGQLFRVSPIEFGLWWDAVQRPVLLPRSMLRLQVPCLPWRLSSEILAWPPSVLL